MRRKSRKMDRANAMAVPNSAMRTVVHTPPKRMSLALMVM